MLVEIILGKNTGDVALAAARSITCALIGKTPIVVNDSRGFYANRCVAALHSPKATRCCWKACRRR